MYMIATSSRPDYGRSQQVFSFLGISLPHGIDRIIYICCVYREETAITCSKKKNLTSDKPSQICRLKSVNLSFIYIPHMESKLDVRMLRLSAGVCVNTHETHYGAVGLGYGALVAVVGFEKLFHEKHTCIFPFFPTTLV